MACAVVLALQGRAQIPAFPGAQGFGAYATGGRGGDVYYVTNLNNNGAGSLRNGLDTAPAAGRTIVFAVSGYIPVVSDTNFNVPSKVTIAGQTAPGDGVGLRGGRMMISGSNVVMRHFRIRHGKNGTGGDCLNIASTASTTMLDHISMMFSTDENFSFFNSSVNNFTLQYSNSTWGMERHNAGGLWDLQNGSCHHTLWAHHRTRNPKARPAMLEWINNVTYHWRNEGFIMGDSQTPANWKANVRGCYYISIDDADTGSTRKSTGFTKAIVASNGVPNFSLYLDDTLFDNNANGLVDGTNQGYAIVSGAEFTPGDAVGSNRYSKSATPFTGATGSAAVTIDDPTSAYKKVISSGSPLRLDANFTGTLRDELDTLLVDSVVDQYSILVQKDGKIAGEDPARTSNGEQLLADQYGITNNGFGTLNGTTPPTDSDLDGMPDTWEIALNGKNGIAYNVAADDHNTAFTAGQLAGTFFPAGTPTGYTLLEEYLHFKAIPHATMAKNSTGSPSVQTIDLRKFTDAFSNTPTFAVVGVYGGTTAQFLADGTTPAANGPIVKFTPTLDLVGRGGFNFTVTDAAGSAWTQQFALLISTSSVPRDLVWIGGGAANAWDTTTTNWRSTSGAATTFGDGDSTLFDDRGSVSPAINLQGSRVVGSMTVTGTKNYAFTGPGTLASTGSLTKAGDTTLTLSAAMTFTAGSFLNGGETILNGGGQISGGAIQFTGGSTLSSGYNSSTTLTINPNLQVNAGAVGNLNLSQRVEINGSLSGGGTFNIFSPSNLGTEGRVYFDGASSGCTGIVNLSGGATAPGNGGRAAFRINDVGSAFNGFGSATLNLTGIDLFTGNNSGGNTYPVGALNGDANSRLRSNYVTGGGATTWTIGGLNTSTTFAGAIMNGVNGAATHVTKTGSGTLTLSGASSYTGNTLINAGRLHLTGSLGTTATAMASGATLSGTGSIGGLVTAQTGSTLSPGTSTGTTGTLTAAAGLSLNAGSNVTFDLRGTLAGPHDKIAVTTGNLTLATSLNVTLNLLDSFLQSGTYHLIEGGAGSTQIGSGITLNLLGLPTTTRQTFSLNRQANNASPAFVDLVVGNTAGTLTWTGTNGSAWDLNSTVNFSGGPSGDNKFYNLDQVTFTDGAASTSVVVTGTLLPQQIIASATGQAFILNTTGGVIGGNASLIKNGSATFTLNASATGNTFTGGTTLSAGTLAVSGASPLGTGPVTITGGTLALPNAATFLPNSMIFSGTSAITSAFSGNSSFINTNTNTMTSSGSATVNLNGVTGILSINGDMSGFTGTLAFGSGSGMLRINSNSVGANDRNKGSAATHFDLGTANASLTNRNGDITIDLGALTGGTSTSLRGRQSGSGATVTTYHIGALGTNTTFSGSIQNGGDSLVHIRKKGSGTWTLAGTSSYSGSLGVDQGKILLTGSLTCTTGAYAASGTEIMLQGGTLTTSLLEINAGSSLTGHGTINGELINNGTLTTSSQTLTITGPVTNNGLMRITGGGTLTANGAFVNYGVLDILTAGGTLPPNLENHGIIIDSSGLKVTSASITGSNFQLTIMAHTGHNYQLQTRDDLTTGSWTNFGSPVSGTGAPITLQHTGGATGPRRFYRVQVE